ncbi:MAG: MBL fold metallo-hydrolase [Bacteroidetes bacterium]|nr:MAG: MBL fold metallo-hydrolase [Bacteroidota bacterium]
MISDEIVIKYIGGPTALFEIGGLRFITDPTFDPANTDYKTPVYVLHKLENPTVQPQNLGKIDFVLLSHDHHFDNLDNSGREFLSSVDKVYTTPKGAERLGANSVGVDHWQCFEVPTRDGRILTITGTPCQHGPADGERGPVTGFVLNFKGETKGGVYISGDTVWFEGVEEVGKRFSIGLAILFMGAATVKEVGKSHLTMSIDESFKAASLFKDAKIVPLHFGGWQHFTEGRAEIEKAYNKPGLSNRLEWAPNF